MALKERQVIDKVEILRNGSIQVREATEIYDTLVTPADEVPEVRDEEGIITQEYTPAVSDVRGAPEFHRSVIAKGTPTPSNVQAFIDNANV